MKKIILSILILFLTLNIVSAQIQDTTKVETVYRAEREKINDLVHTKLKVSFDYAKSQMAGEAWITLKPHFYPVQTVTLDAKGMLIHKVSRDGKALKYDYDGNKLSIKLDNLFVKDEEYTLHITYTARPEEVTQEGSAAISDAKGLYFIDPLETDPDKPTQIWTQGETEASSCWFPTIDSPNQKTTQEIYMTVPNKYVTLSNGLLESQTENGDGTRTDYWNFDKPHAPYLFFMGVGDFAIVKDTWNDIAVDYYVEKEYEPYAKEIFGNTPEMLTFFSELTGIEYPWQKYAQIVCRDYVSGAMENTTAVIHAENANQTSGQLIDTNVWENTIAHEAIHHWFGNLVTAESWSNLSMNESFANYSEYLWQEYKYGKDYADAHRYDDVQGYFMGGNESKKLVRFHYGSREDMFDAVSYNKGGAILHMLRHYLGDKAFFAGLKEYLISNKYQTGEAHQLRLALEEISGKDLNPFFNQWFFDSGHPKLNVSYIYNDENKSVTVLIKQTTDKVFEFPLDIDVYENGVAERYKINVKNKEEKFTIKYKTKPQLINIDADKILLAEIKDEKPIDNYIYQYNNKKANFLDRRNAIEILAADQDNKEAYKTLMNALNDKYYGLRILALDKIDVSKDKSTLKIIENLATSDDKTLVKAKAIKVLGKLDDKKYANIFKEATKSKSYSVKSNAIAALYKIDKGAALDKVVAITNPLDKKGMLNGLLPVYVNERLSQEMPFIADKIISGLFFNQDPEVQALYGQAFQWIATSDNLKATKNMVDDFVAKANQYKKYGADAIIKQMLQQVQAGKEQLNSSNKEELIAIVKQGIADIK
ncbi:M1 family metallopeptidase [Aureibaculum sp. 2210JD6-5]|uniref:M1 family metallopeptidase n=1 Tax=Aureibaculum sp. 2210JD6-5 TaxID=3103957 RepID=UPI002AADAD4C|nr:M1 family metallopeptidase [Aureibaculum sp. 2210JD6-5]MDY7394032.1 M1 family metallopeptidase [Aureibaculum sp. 2210JD6-5]